MNICEISSGDTLGLRNEVLRPGKDITECIFPGDEAPDTRHFGAFDGQSNVVGIVSVYRKNHPAVAGDEPYQIRGMATKANHRGHGAGALLLAAAERYAKSRGSKVIWANARTSAMGFYTKHGYSPASEEFVIEGVGPHYLVVKALV